MIATRLARAGIFLAPILLGATLHSQKASGSPPPLRPLQPPRVWVLDAAGGAGSHFAVGQAAIDAAGEKDLIVVRSGYYSPVVVDGKSLSIVSMQAADVTMGVTVQNLASGQSVLLRGIEGWNFTLENNLGFVHLLDLRGTAGGDGVTVRDSLRVNLTRFTTPYAGRPGGGAIRVFDSDVRVYDADARGVGGGTCGDGASGILAGSSQLYVSGSRLQGGNGSYCPPDSGVGGAGIELFGSTAILLDNELIPGAPGCVLSCLGTPGLKSDATSSATTLPGTAHRLAIVGPAADGGIAKMTFDGDLGEDVYLWFGYGPRPVYVLSLSGFVHLDHPSAAEYVGRLSRSGVLEHFVPVRTPLFLEAQQVFYETLFVNPSGVGPDYVATPDELVVVGAELFPAGPDCNGNRVPDAIDITTTFSRDLNGNGLPDECVSEGDCNGNLVGDVEDITSLVSTDLNTNWIPDECPTDSDCNTNGLGDIGELQASTLR